MKTFIIFLIFSCLFNAFANAQNMQGKRALERPEVFLAPLEKEAQRMTHDGKRMEGILWVVYSDRSNNHTVKNIGDEMPHKMLEFMEDFYVAEERGDYLLLVKDPEPIYGSDGFVFSSDSENYGWINKSYMLLWSNSLEEETGGIPIKAMTQNTLDYIEGMDLRFQDMVDVDYFYNPELSRPTGRQIRLYEILYVYKMTDRAVLLGTSSYLHAIADIEGRRRIIYGWVPRDRVVLWDNRVVIEPNWMGDAVAERERKNIMASIFYAHDDAHKFSVGSQTEFPPIIREAGIGEGGFYRSRQIGEWQRYPLLDAQNNIMRVGVMGEITTETTAIDRVTFANIDRQVSRITEQLGNINIVFVMDGTNSMRDYFHPTSEAVIKGMNMINAQMHDNIVFRFGAVVYRDEPEREFNRLTEIKPLTENYRDVAKWLEQINVEEFGHDPWLEEAVYYGLREALISVVGDSDQTNLLVLIGDAGNHSRDDRSQVDENIIIQLLAGKNTHLLAFQVNNRDHAAYDDFQEQVKRLALKQAEIMLSKIDANERPPGTPTWSQLDNNRIRLDNSINMATLVSPPKGQAMPPNVLTEEIMSLVAFAEEYTIDRTEGIRDMVQRGRSLEEVLEEQGQSPSSNSKYVGAFDYAMIYLLSRLEIDQNILQALSERRGQIYTPAYTPMTKQDLDHPLYKRSLLLSREELGQLVRIFGRLQRVSAAADRRTNLRDTWTEILITHLGESDREVIMQRSIEDVMRTVVGIPSTNTLINTLRLEDITSPGRVSDGEINRYIRDIELKHRDLTRIFNQSNPPYEYSFSSGNVHYYWISEDYIP